jgi:cation:H+ antiporter
MHDMPVWVAPILLVMSFAVLAKSADWLVDGAVGIAERLGVPKFIIGVVLVGVATSAPEFAVSLLSALTGKPEMALGNVVGSNVVNDGVGLALVGFLAVTPVVMSRRSLFQAAAFLVAIDGAAFILVVTNRTATGAGEEQFVLGRWGGVVLLALLLAYLGYLIRDRIRRPDDAARTEDEKPDSEAKAPGRGSAALFGLFCLGLALIIGSSYVLVESAVVIARALHVREAIIALSVIAIGTSIPEIATCIAASRKGQGALAVGNILGSDIINVAGIAGASALAHPLAVSADVVRFMFPAMLLVMVTTIAGLLIQKRMTRLLGGILICEYVVYVALMAALFPPKLG